MFCLERLGSVTFAVSEAFWTRFCPPYRAARAQNLGLFRQEIVPVVTKFVDADGKERTATVAEDDGIRAGTTLAGLGKLPPAFKPGGGSTAGESVGRRGELTRRGGNNQNAFCLR